MVTNIDSTVVLRELLPLTSAAHTAQMAVSGGALFGAAAYLRAFVGTRHGQVALLSLASIALAGAGYLWGIDAPWWQVPLMIATAAAGIPLLLQVVRDALHRHFGADLLGMLSLITAGVLGEWFVAGIIALMLSGGQALEEAASARASQVLDALARRSPTIAHRRGVDGAPIDVDVAAVQVGDDLVLLPHEICPVDGTVVEGVGAMDESYLTGEPYVVPKAPGSSVLSGAINSTVALVIRADAVAAQSRYAQIVGVLARAEEQRPPIRRLADRLGIGYTVLALALAGIGWWVSGDPNRFLAVLVIATPCPLLIGVPVAVIGAISLAARHGIIVKDPSMLERISTARTMIFDKTGTLTYGKPMLVNVHLGSGFRRDQVLGMVGSLERFSRHPLSTAILEASADLPMPAVDRVSEKPGAGVSGVVGGRQVQVTGRHAVTRDTPDIAGELPPEVGGLECVIIIDGAYAATLQFRDEPRVGARDFIGHLDARHRVQRVILMSGDRASEVEYLAQRVGVDEAHASVSPEQKLAMVKAETEHGPTVFLGDGINDAPAMTAATVGVSFGTQNDVTAEAADAVVLDSSLERLDVLMHIGRRMRRVALQGAIGGIALSAIGMGLAVAGILVPIAGAIAQELIDVAAILNATRVAFTRGPMTDYQRHTSV
jgi:heavy metal translocating P-type ATPase